MSRKKRDKMITSAPARKLLPRIAMVPPVAVSPLIKTARWSALLLGVFYGKQRFEYLKPIAEQERMVEEAEKKIREEQERIYKQLSEANSDSILQ
ncbi:ATP synthase subunit e, mitochondrial-like [Micropterus salmoides]|uniref:ATP synthase subunit e, mitochondrial-like n=2 Tax=Micropterus TaxID=27705 RepID=UPI0018ED1A72|nr:ATP synthase subunit e, mitochondrial-like [Micropterus salmoides]